MANCSKLNKKIRKKLESICDYEDEYLYDKLTNINNLVNEILDHCDQNRLGLLNKDKFDKIKHILKEVHEGTDYYLLEFNDGTSVQSYGDYTVKDNEISFAECVFFDAWDNGEEVSEYTLTKSVASGVYAVKFYNPITVSDDVIFI